MSHRCPSPGCPTRVSEDMLACKGHWMQLPAPIRLAVNDTWARRASDPDAHLAAVAEALRYFLRPAETS